MGSKPVGISASRASAIVGLNPYQSPFEVWQLIMEERKPGFNESRGYLLPEEPDNASIRWGNAFEGAIIELADQRQGRAIKDREWFFETTDLCNLTCHVDGIYEYKEGEESPVLHEGKTTSFFTWKDKWGEPGTDKIPPEYQIQVQHQMICTGASEVVVSALVFPKRVEEFEELGWNVEYMHSGVNKGWWLVDESGPVNPMRWAIRLKEMGYFHQYPVKANPKLQKKLLEIYSSFWQDHVIAEKPPLQGATYDDLRRLLPNPVGTIVCDSKAEALFSEYKQITEQIGASGTLAKRKEAVKVEILAYMKSQEAVKDDESQKKWVFRDDKGNKLGQYDGKTFRG